MQNILNSGSLWLSCSFRIKNWYQPVIQDLMCLLNISLNQINPSLLFVYLFLLISILQLYNSLFSNYEVWCSFLRIIIDESVQSDTLIFSTIVIYSVFPSWISFRWRVFSNSEIILTVLAILIWNSVSLKL